MTVNISGIFLLSLLLWTPMRLQAQCERSEYKIILPLIEQDLAARNYERAINRLLYARDICPDEKEQINRIIRKAFMQIEQEKITADSALEVASRVLEQMYFYADKFGLTLKEIDYDGSGKYRYGFIDRQGQEVIDFKFEEASPFDKYDGFARVRMAGKKYLLDTTGTTYLLAERFEELRLETVALDIHEIADVVDSFPDDLGVYKNLRIILAYGKLEKGPDDMFPSVPTGMISHLPASIIELSNLSILDLSNNRLVSLPKRFGNLSQLQHLNLTYNQLAGLPDDFGNLPLKQYLDLSNNRLKRLPESIGNLKHVESLFLFGNHLSSLPSSLVNMSQLKNLEISDNQFTELPAVIEQFRQLESLYLMDNQLQVLPEFIGNLRGIQALDLAGNQLSTLPMSIINLNQLDIIYLDGNPIDQLPKEICRFLSRTLDLEVFLNINPSGMCD